MHTAPFMSAIKFLQHFVRPLLCRCSSTRCGEACAVSASSAVPTRRHLLIVQTLTKVHRTEGSLSNEVACAGLANSLYSELLQPGRHLFHGHACVLTRAVALDVITCAVIPYITTHTVIPYFNTRALKPPIITRSVTLYIITRTVIPYIITRAVIPTPSRVLLCLTCIVMPAMHRATHYCVCHVSMHVYACMPAPCHLRDDFYGTAYLSATWRRQNVCRTATGEPLRRFLLYCQHNLPCIFGSFCSMHCCKWHVRHALNSSRVHSCGSYIQVQTMAPCLLYALHS